MQRRGAVHGFGLAAVLALGGLAPLRAQTAGQTAVPLVTPSPALSATQAPAPAPQVLTLDQDRLYTGSLFGRAMEAKAQVASQALAAENRRIEADLATEEADLTQQRVTMQAPAFQTLADAFDAKVEQLRKDQAAKVDALKAGRDADRQTFFKAAVPVLAELMGQLGAYAILNHDAVVLAFDAIDVTDRAIASVDAKLGDGSAAGPRLQPADDAAPQVQTPAPAPVPAP